MPYTTLGSATAGEVYTASAHNAIIGNLNSLGPAAFNVQSTALTSTFETNSTTYTDVTGLSVAITPSAATSKILVIASLFLWGAAAQTNGFARLMRGSTAIGVGATAGSRTPVSMFTTDGDGCTTGICFLDSPATTSATTYKVQIRTENAAYNCSVNYRQGGDGDGSSTPRGISTITAIEIPV